MRCFCLLALAFLFSCHAKRPGMLPRPDHIVIVMEENHSFSGIIGSSYAPFINQVATEGMVFTQSFAITHPSQLNYLSLFSGDFQGALDDSCLAARTPFTTPNLGAALIHAGFSFKGYAEDLPSTGFLGCAFGQSTVTRGGLYARKHAPWINWVGNKENNIPDSCSLPLTAFPTDFKKLPTVSFVIPNEDNDMHNENGDSMMVARGDNWLQQHLGAYIEWARTHNSLFILTYDEDNGTPQNQIPTIFAGQMINPGRTDMKINHFAVLRTIEAIYGLPESGSHKADPISLVWQ